MKTLFRLALAVLLSGVAFASVSASDTVVDLWGNKSKSWEYFKNLPNAPVYFQNNSPSIYYPTPYQYNQPYYNNGYYNTNPQYYYTPQGYVQPTYSGPFLDPHFNPNFSPAGPTYEQLHYGPRYVFVSMPYASGNGYYYSPTSYYNPDGTLRYIYPYYYRMNSGTSSNIYSTFDPQQIIRTNTYNTFDYSTNPFENPNNSYYYWNTYYPSQPQYNANLPDLTLGNLRQNGTRGEFVVTVCNYGGDMPYTASVNFRVSNSGYYKSVPLSMRLPASSCTDTLVDFVNLNISSAGTYTITVEIDSSMSLKESNESNNISTRSISVSF